MLDIEVAGRCQRPATSRSNNLSRTQNQRLLAQFKAPDDGRCVAQNMLSFIYSDTPANKDNSFRNHIR